MIKEVEITVKHWLQEIVIGLNLCPFAKAPLLKNAIHFYISDAHNEEDVVYDLLQECERLDQNSNIETTLMIYPEMFESFIEYNNFLSIAERVLKQNQWDGIYQIASFHPHYQFSDTDPEDPENLTNRAPYPILHLLREDALSKAIEGYKNTEEIPEHNIKTINSLSRAEKEKYFYYLGSSD
jgi:hypothetical protein